MKAHPASRAGSDAAGAARPEQTRVGELGFWWRSVGGASYTALWTAYYLKLAEPSLRIALLEREHAGFGASGRNAGWVSGFFSGPARGDQRRSGRAAPRALRPGRVAT